MKGSAAALRTTTPDGFTAYGVDGCRRGWFVVQLRPSGPPKHCVTESVSTVVTNAGDADRVFIDIPIGLPHDSRERACDKAARAALKRPRASSVFRAPVREVFAARDHRHAGDISAEATGKRITQQTWAIVPKIKEVDELLRRSAKARRIVREVHPEVCFWGLAGRAMGLNKKTKGGFKERLTVLTRVWPCAEEFVDHVLRRTKRKDVARDDILDAVVAALVACQAENELRHFPCTRETDQFKLPMEMVWAHPPRVP